MTDKHSRIRQMLDAHWGNWKSGKTSMPVHSNAYENPGVATTVRPKLAAVLPRFIRCDPAYIDCDIPTYHAVFSARSAGFDVRHFAADDILYDIPKFAPVNLTKGKLPEAFRRSLVGILPSQLRNNLRPRIIGALSRGRRRHTTLTTGLDQLDKFLSEERPNVVVFDGNFEPTAHTISVGHLANLKRRHDFKLVNIIGDCYDGIPNFLAAWSSVSDLSVIFHRYSEAYDRFGDKSKIMVCPAIPFHEESFRGAAPPVRDLGLSYLGSDTRGRKDLMDFATHLGIPTYAKFHRRERSEAPALGEFISILRRSKIAFNTGGLPSGGGVITGRVGEAILSEALLLQEYGTPIDDYLVPFIHYVPFLDRDEMVGFARFFLNDEERRSRIANEAGAFWRNNYSSAAFWSSVMARLYGQLPVPQPSATSDAQKPHPTGELL